MQNGQSGLRALPFLAADIKLQLGDFQVPLSVPYLSTTASPTMSQ